MSNKFPIVFGSRNAKKAREMNDLFGPSEIALTGLHEFPQLGDVAETGSTFAENARLKAIGYAAQIGCWVLAEDSGLSVAALGGEPGVWSARYAGEPAADERNNQKLLATLRGVPAAQRTAWYTCSMALADPQGQVWITSEGRCYGRIVEEYRGGQGFGYDPLFEVVEYHQTFGELGLAVKSLISHRARAARQFLREFARRREELESARRTTKSVS